MENDTASLSSRGQVFAKQAEEELLLKVLADLWDPKTNPSGYLNLGVAENMLMHRELVDYMTQNFEINSHALTYGDGFSGSLQLRKAIARFITTQFKPVEPVLGSHVVVTAGVTLALESCAFSLCDAGDGALLARPYYGSFPEDLAARARVEVIPVSLEHVDPFSERAVAAYEEAMVAAEKKGIKVRVLLLCNPHNPLGRCYTREALVGYMQFCQKHNLHLISDEIYALSTWHNPDDPDAPDFTSLLSVNPVGVINPQLVHVLWGMSKVHTPLYDASMLARAEPLWLTSIQDFGSNGLRLGCVISQHNKAFHNALTMNSYFSCPSSAADRITLAILSDDHFVKSFMAENKSRLAKHYLATVRFLEAHGIPYQKGTNAGFFVWANLLAPSMPSLASSKSELHALENKLQQTLLDHKVFLATGTAFGNPTPGWFRIIFAHERAYLDEGLKRIVEAMRRVGIQLQTK
ncbi:1-aminocyclopropane-1-carboxylate synthase [Fusarium albosuccineum]|uniref:1-aminocyclopropane-1-carboxylate synthase n=1 Tax=Fusarium albosuccineum TaxID=1237068 RepID=A0A8H4P478_9HYPO|nr:1-aminocyclopropane-1-carboxylate synthase [Fusarium albosuccineum]